MAEPVTTAAHATLAASAAAVPILSVFGVPLGLRADELLAGFAGALAAISLLDSVPMTGDTLMELTRSSLRRVFVALGSAVTAGYLVPLLAIIVPMPLHQSLELSLAFVVGAGAQRILRAVIERTAKKAEAAE